MLFPQRMPDEFGFKQTESHLNEWHFLNADWKRLRNDPVYARAKFAELNCPVTAAFTAAVLLTLQDCPVDVANYYSGDTLQWDFLTGSGCLTKHTMPSKLFALSWLHLNDSPALVAMKTKDLSSELASSETDTLPVFCSPILLVQPRNSVFNSKISSGNLHLR